MVNRSTPVDDIPGLVRVENTSGEELKARCVEMTSDVCAHQEGCGQYLTIERHVACPPEVVFDYLSRGHHLEEWTFSLRDFAPTGTPGLWAGNDRLEEGTRIYCRVEAHRGAMTVDYHCAWDQGDKLWMIYLMRVVPASLVLDRPGSVIIWTNCRHPFYRENPRPDLCPRPDRRWVGEYWDLFRAGHTVEMDNLQAIVEHRYRNGVPVASAAGRAS